MNKLLDLRFIIGLFFILVGVLLLGYAMFSSGATPGEARINGSCSALFILFGLGMVLLSLRQKKE